VNSCCVLRYRLELESRRLSSSTINLRLAAVRRLAYEAADTGLLSPELAAGIGRVKGAKRVGVRLGNWLSADEVKQLLRSPDLHVLKGKRDRAMIAVLAGCGLRRSEVAHLSISDIQKRDERWVIVDLYGKGDVSRFGHRALALSHHSFEPRTSPDKNSTRIRRNLHRPNDAEPISYIIMRGAFVVQLRNTSEYPAVHLEGSVEEVDTGKQYNSRLSGMRTRSGKW
jgi:integrase